MRAIPLSLAVLVAAAAPETVAAQSGGSLQTCLAAAADYSPVYPTVVFPLTSPELDAVFRLGQGEHYKRLSAKWIAVDVGSVAPPNTLAGHNDLTLTRNTTAGVLRFELRKGFPPGKYRLDVSADGKPWKSVEFQVVQGPGGAGLASLGALMPLAKGTAWTYAFVQEAGGIAKITKAPPGATLGADGKVRATVTATVTGTETQGVHLAWARGGVPYSEEWWQLTDRGLAASQRKTDGETVALDPPQIVFAWPVAMGRHWDYVSRDHTLRQTYRVWGPVAVKGPNGEAPGYVVLVQQKGPMATITVEREYLPGLGMVRSLTIRGLGSDMVSREELVLTDVR